MPAPQMPFDEPLRLAELRAMQILDTDPEPGFDRISRMAKEVFGMPVALVSLVDADRQWFKSRIGLEAKEAPRSTSFCGHAILGDDALIVEDATADPRFADNPAVMGDPCVRFYAGQPLRGPLGHRVGTLCVVDYRPRSFPVADRERLRDLAILVEQEFEIRTLARAVADEKELSDFLEVAREAMAGNERRFRALAEAAFEAVVIHDHGEILLVNPAFAETFRIDAEAARLGHLLDYMEPDSREIVLERIARGATEAYEVVALRADSTTFPAEIRGRTIMLGDRPVRVAAVHDISDRRSLEARTNELIALVSHELRNPLSAIRLSLHLLTDDSNLSEELLKVGKIGLSSADRLLRLLNDLLQNERLEGRMLPVQKRRVLAGDLIDQAVQEMAALAADFGVALDFRSPDFELDADVDLMVQAISNLTHNAVKFSPAGTTVSVEADRVAAEAVFAVRDQGRGISEADKDKLFTRFSQLAPGDRRGGSGLGLSICRGIAEAHGGRIWCQSEIGAGTTFYIAIPLSR